jgi:tRNA A-37 threonylcarbamoyl transferase component Bud32
MEMISRREFVEICRNINTLTIKLGHADRPKVLEKDGRTIVKIFYPKKKWVTSDKLKPRAMRFYDNVQRLHQQGYAVPNITKTQYCSSLKTYLIHYDKISGEDVRTFASRGNLHIIHRVAQLMADLHQKGIFFRSIHLENLLHQEDGRLALIDISDVRFKHRPLSLHLRYRNIKHLLQATHDKEIWAAFSVDRFLESYCKAAAISRFGHKMLAYFLKKI